MTSPRNFILFLVCVAGLSFAQTLPPEARFVMSHFKGDGGGGDERLYISWSADGLNWTALNNGQPVWQPPNWGGFVNVVRDPTIIFHDGYYWVAYTSGNYGKGTTYGLVKSTDLLNWTFVTLVNAALPNSTDQLTWSPIFFEDGDGSIHVIVAINPVGGSQYNPIPTMRVHEMHPLNADWTQWSAPIPLQLPDTNNNDCWVWKEGLTYHAAYADFSTGGTVVHATSNNLITGWVRHRYLGYNAQEGNIVLPKPEGGYRLYLEPGNSGTPEGFRTCDFDANFLNATPQVLVNSTVPMRNGKICAARQTISYAQWRDQKLAPVPAEKRVPLADADEDGLLNLSECAFATDPLVFTTAASRPNLFTRILPDGKHPGLIYRFLRSSTDTNTTPEVKIGENPWSSTPGDLTIESLTLMSDGVTRVQAATVSPLATEPILLRVNTNQDTVAAPAALNRSISASIAVSSSGIKRVIKPASRSKRSKR